VTYLKSIRRSVSVSALIALSMVPAAAYAGKHTMAVEAIAAAKGKIDAGDKVSAGRQAPELQAQARASLSSAQDLLAKGHKDEAISAARHAGEFADQAIVSAENSRTTAERERRHDAQDTAAVAIQSASDANVRASLAQQATADANASANDANKRAVMAQQATADATMSATEANRRLMVAQQATTDANARTDALRNTPPTPTTTTTTVAMVHDETAHTSAAPARRTIHRTVRHRAHSGRISKNTTTITTTHS